MAKRSFTAPPAILPRVCLIGQRFGLLVVTEFVGRHGRAWQWRCICDCGQTKIATTDHLREGSPDSCGCKAVTKKHGHSKTHPLYKNWIGMRQRCQNRNSGSYPSYGGRGITVCDRWNSSFPAFIADMGPRPSHAHTIERIDNSKGYSPDNCRWATRMEQTRNTRTNYMVEFQGRQMSLAEAAEIAGLDYDTIRNRLRRGWSEVDALSKPVHVHRRHRK